MRVFVLMMMVFVAGLNAQTARYAHHGTQALPDATETPGAINPLAVADLSGARHIKRGIEYNLCAKDFRTKAIRRRIRNFQGLKKRACKAYGVARCDRSVEGDHLISIEIGGCPDCLANLWPQPMAQARVKDHRVEDMLPKLVCAGRMTLEHAQECIAGDWVACEERVKQLQ